MGTLNTHSFTWTGDAWGKSGSAACCTGSPTTTMGVYLPTSFATGRPQKWVILVHGGGGDWQIGVTEARFQTLCDTYDLAMVTATQADANSHQFWDYYGDYSPVDNLLHIRDHELQMKVAAVALYPELGSYLPCIMGASMGGLVTLRAAVYHPESFSAFGACCPMADAIWWATQRGAGFDGERDYTFGGLYYPTGDAVKDSVWLRDSPGHTIATANLQGRKIWTNHGTADPTISYSQVWQPFVAQIPAANLQAARTVTGGLHDWNLFDASNYGAELFGWFASASVPTVSVKAWSANAWVSISVQVYNVSVWATLNGTVFT